MLFFLYKDAVLFMIFMSTFNTCIESEHRNGIRNFIHVCIQNSTVEYTIHVVLWLYMSGKLPSSVSTWHIRGK